ncbi:MAG: glycosyltransferase [Clostridia bacterium]|nr:glycosyltransferase [Clostridia bacterium]
MSLKKIVYIAESAGGVAEYLKNFLNNTSQEFENFLIVSYNYKNIISQFKYIKSENIYYVDMVRDISLVKDISAIFKIRKFIKQINPDTVYMHSSKAGALGRCSLLFCKKRIKKIYNAHGWYFNASINKIKKIIFTLIERILALNTDIIVNISYSELTSALKNKVGNIKKNILIENAVPFEKYEVNQEARNTIRNKYNLKNSDILVGIVGRLSEQKDPITTIKVAEIIIKKYSNVYFMFVGDGNLKNEVIEYSIKNKIKDNIIITGWVEDVENYINAFDIAMLPSMWEGFGLAITEYVANKKMIVASKVGGIEDILKDYQYSYLIQSGDYNQFAKKISSIIQNKEYIIDKNVLNYELLSSRYSMRRLINEHMEVFK